MEKANIAIHSATDGVKNVINLEKKTKAKKQKGGDSGEDAGPLELSPQPQFIDHRIQVFDKLKSKFDAEIAAKPRYPIEITLVADGKPGKVVEGKAWETSTCLRLPNLTVS